MTSQDSVPAWLFGESQRSSLKLLCCASGTLMALLHAQPDPRGFSCIVLGILKQMAKSQAVKAADRQPALRKGKRLREEGGPFDGSVLILCEEGRPLASLAHAAGALLDWNGSNDVSSQSKTSSTIAVLQLHKHNLI